MSDREPTSNFRGQPGIRFSVVVPLFNKAPWIGRCLASIRASDTGSIGEVIVVDDGSSDGGGEIAQQADAGYGKIRVISQPNGGVSAARNRGIRAASHEHVLLLDADDEWCPGFVGEIENLLEACPDSVIASTSFQFVLADGSTIPARYAAGVLGAKPGYVEDFVRAVARGDSPAHPSCACITKSAWESVGGFPEGVAHGEDKIFWLRLARHGRVAWSPSVQMRRHMALGNNADDSWTPQKGGAYLEEVQRLLREERDLSRREGLLELYLKELGQFGRAAARKRNAAPALWAARELLRHGERRNASFVALAMLLPVGAYEALKARYRHIGTHRSARPKRSA